MKFTTLKSILALALAGAVMSCDRGTISSDQLKSNSDGNNGIYRSYHLLYNEGDDQVVAAGILSVGGEWGTTVQLVEPARLVINGVMGDETTGIFSSPLSLVAGVNGTHYIRRFTGLDVPVRFVFTDSEGNQFADQAELPNVELNMPTAGSFTTGFSLLVVGDLNGGSVNVRLSQGEKSKSDRFESSWVEVTPEMLSEFSAGEIQVSVDVRSTTAIPADKRSLGGRISTSYTFAKRSIQLR